MTRAQPFAWLNYGDQNLVITDAVKQLWLKVRPEFEFRRRKRGCEVFLRFHGGLNLNLTPEDEQLLTNRSAARVWAFEFAAKYGFKPMEYRRTKSA